MKPVYMWSTNEENYHGDDTCHTVLDAIQEAIKEENLIPGDKLWISKMNPLNPPEFHEFMSVDLIMDNANEYISDNTGFEDCLIEPSNEQEAELMNELSKTWKAWHLKHPKMVTKYFEAVAPRQFVINPNESIELIGKPV